jgi:hypothetical protein
VSLADLGRVAAAGEVVSNIYGGYTVYGWTHVLQVDGRTVPVRLFIGHRVFKFSAWRLLNKWIEAQIQAHLNGVTAWSR